MDRGPGLEGFVPDSLGEPIAEGRAGGLEFESPADNQRPLLRAAPLVPRIKVSPARQLIDRWMTRLSDWSDQSLQDTKDWFNDNGVWYLVSALVHFIVLIVLMLCMVHGKSFFGRSLENTGFAPSFQPADVDVVTPPPDSKIFEVGDASLEPTELTTETLMQFERPSQTAQFNDNSKEFQEAGGGTQIDATDSLLAGAGGMMHFDIRKVGGSHKGGGGLGSGQGTGVNPGSGGAGEGYGSRGSGSREAWLGGFGGTKASERAVAAALNWLYRHRSNDGRWTLQHMRRCSGGVDCSGPGLVRSDAAATGLALLPFLAAGQTHKSNGPYRKAINDGVYWLLKAQEFNGDLSANGDANVRMYAHAIAAIALCEAYGMTKDEKVGSAAQRAIVFIERAQNENTGGWRYEPQDPSGDTSVLGWQMIALRSAQLAGLAVDSTAFERSKKWLASVAKGERLGLYSYQPYREVTPTMTAVGMLCRQYLGATRDDPAMTEGKNYLMANMPDATTLRNSYYWYYATLVMHNFIGPEWDEWNRKMRRTLIESQIKVGCASGSWDPEKPTIDTYGSKGGRLMVTALSALTLEVYYRHLPLFRVDMPDLIKMQDVAAPAVR